MKVAIFACIVGIVGIALAIPHPTSRNVGKVADKEFLEVQRNILRLLMHVHQPNSFQDQIQLAKSFKPTEDKYNNATVIKEWVQYLKSGRLPRKAIFSILDEHHRYEATLLYKVLYSAKTFETFYQTAAWARDNINEGIFVYALTLAVLHRPDTKGMVLPAPYEIYPYYFINSEVINKAHEYQMQNFAYFKPQSSEMMQADKDINTGKSDMWSRKYRKTVSGLDDLNQWRDEAQHNIPFQHEMWQRKSMLEDTRQSVQNIKDANVVIIPSNYSGWYLNVDPEQKMSYFTEDVGLNAYYYYLHADYPFWMEGAEYGLNKDRRGEYYLYIHQQLLARTYLERLSNGLGRIPFADYTEPMKYSYEPSLHYENGLEFPWRPTEANLIKDEYTEDIAEKLHTLEVRLLNVIDSGFIYTEDGNRVPIYTEDGINILGNLIEGNPDSINPRLYGYMQMYARVLYGYSGKPLTHQKLHPGAVEHYETALRDPSFYAIYKKIVGFYKAYKDHLPSYTYSELNYPGIKIESVNVDKLVTYFDYFDVEINNAIYSDFTKETEVPDVIVKARQMRLNHKPYTYKVNVYSDKDTSVVVRVYLGPKYDEFGREFEIEENRVNFVEIDQFVYKVKSGKNVIERNSAEARHTVEDRTSYYQLYQHVMSALDNSEQFVLDNTEAHCGYPNRLLLPKGKKGGMVYQVYVVVTPYDGKGEKTPEDTYTCGVGSGRRYLDNLPMGYPLDRKIYSYGAFKTPNMFFQDVVIYHKHMDEINSVMH